MWILCVWAGDIGTTFEVEVKGISSHQLSSVPFLLLTDFFYPIHIGTVFLLLPLFITIIMLIAFLNLLIIASFKPPSPATVLLLTTINRRRLTYPCSNESASIHILLSCSLSNSGAAFDPLHFLRFRTKSF